MYLEWEDKFSTGSPLFDSQHQKIFYLINALHSTVKSGSSKESQAKIISELIETTSQHFKAEEDEFEKLSYSKRKQHAKEHESLLEHINAFKSDFDAGKTELDDKSFESLFGWLIEHIENQDKDYGAFSKKKRRF